MGESGASARYISEFVGTFMLVFTVGCNVITGQTVWGGVSIACVLTVMIYSLGKSSGGNFNPAVSFALGLCQKMAWVEVFIYMAVQIVAGVCAGFCYAGMFGQAFKLEPAKGHTWWQAGLAETLYTFMLCFVVLNVAVSKAAVKASGGMNQYYGLAIGFVIVAGAYGAGSISMGCFNPAVAFGIDVSSYMMPDFITLKYCFIYAAFEFLGATLAAGAFKICRPEERDGAEYSGDYMPLDYPVSSKLFSEFLGTYMLVLTVGLNVLNGSPAAAFSIASALMCMIFALGNCSGAHFNPAVTTAVICRGKCTLKDGAMYMGIQVLAGICAAFTYTAMMNGKTFELYHPGSLWQALIAETIFTFVLAFVVLSVATVKNPLSEYFGFAIGMCVTVGGFAIGKVSGASLNPAVSIGVMLSHIAHYGGLNLLSTSDYTLCLQYSVAEILGGLLAAGVFFLTQPSENQDKTMAEEPSYGATA